MLSFQPLSTVTWNDFETLFGEKGACGGCWCMLWRLTNSEFEQSKGEGNKALMQQLASEEKPLGLIVYKDEKAAGWCSVSPRKDFVRLNTSRVLKAVDDAPVWSVSCFFISKEYRNQGIGQELLKAAITYAFDNGADIVEAYPKIPVKGAIPAVFAWTGIYSMFEKAGFKEVVRHSEHQPIMRYEKP